MSAYKSILDELDSNIDENDSENIKINKVRSSIRKHRRGSLPFESINVDDKQGSLLNRITYLYDYQNIKQTHKRQSCNENEEKSKKRSHSQLTITKTLEETPSKSLNISPIQDEERIMNESLETIDEIDDIKILKDK